MWCEMLTDCCSNPTEHAMNVHTVLLTGVVAFTVQLHDQHVHKSQEGEHVTIAMEGEGGASEPQQLEAEEGSESWGWSSFKSLLPQSLAASSADKALTSPLLQQGAHDRPPQTGTQVCVQCECGVCVCVQCVCVCVCAVCVGGICI